MLGTVCGAAPVHARHSLCASVSIQIEQEPAAFAAGVKRKDSTVGCFCFTMKDDDAARDHWDTAQVLFDAPIVGKGMRRLDEMVSLQPFKEFFVRQGTGTCANGLLEPPGVFLIFNQAQQVLVVDERQHDRLWLSVRINDKLSGFNGNRHGISRLVLSIA